MICHGSWILVKAGLVRGRTLTSWPSLQTDIRNAGGTWVDEEVHVDTAGPNTLVSSRKPDDLPAFCQNLVKTFAEQHVPERAVRSLWHDGGHGEGETVTAIVCSVEIARAPGEVYSYVTDPAHFGEWQAGVIDGHIEPAGPVQVGSRCVMTRRIGGADRTSTSVITELTPAADLDHPRHRRPDPC